MEEKVGLEDVLAAVKEGLAEYSEKVQVLAVYLVGSRAFGVHSSESDYDFIVVVDCCDEYAYEIPGLKLIEKGLLNCSVYHIKYFESLVQENIVWAVMCLFLSEGCVWLKPSGAYLDRLAFQLRKVDLRRVALLDADHNWGKAKRLWKTEQRVAKKNIAHSLRFPILALQLLEHAAIVDIRAGNEYFHEIMGNPSESWADYQRKYKPTLDDLCSKVRRNTEPLPIPPLQYPEQLKTAVYIKEYGLVALSRELNIRVVPHPKFRDIYWVCSDSTHSLEENEVVHECTHGIILHIGEVNILCYSHSKIEDMTGSTLQSINWHGIRASRLPIEGDGLPSLGYMRRVSMYYHEDSWNLCTSASPTGADPLIKVSVSGVGSYYRFSKRTHYDPWKFFDNDIMPTRQAFLEANKASLLSHSEEATYNTFDTLFWDLWKLKGYTCPSDTTGRHCYTFDVYVKRIHKLTLSDEGSSADRIVLTSVRDLATLQLLDCREVERISITNRWECAWSEEDIRFESTAALYKLSQLDPTNCVGFCLCDTECQNKRSVLLSPQYTAMKELCWCPAENESKRELLMLRIVKTNNHMAFLKYFPSWEDLYQRTAAAYGEFCERVTKLYAPLTHMERADFARSAKVHDVSPALFALYNAKQTDVQRFLSLECDEVQIHKWMALMQRRRKHQR